MAGISMIQGANIQGANIRGAKPIALSACPQCPLRSKIRSGRRPRVP
jgi:hypothetical protein